ncbi:hypothetical protein AAFC00_000399 [Neodothiora populina]|uniref:PQ loop repeat protein n=1 Tax=Neodothiora populina TaxID=2781224 RepID=A0ABR3PD82_9PEZI
MGLEQLSISSLITWLITHIAPVFLVTSPVTSYGDQIYAMHRSRSSAGFSLDIPLIMLVASILKLFYWLGAHYDMSLLLQAGLMVIVQSVLLHVALQNRPPSRAANTPFAGSANGDSVAKRPFNFWQWRLARPYWKFLGYYSLTLLILQAIFGQTPWFTALQGYIALSIEATLPLPQILSNQRNRSCKGFRLSVLANWLLGDAMKMCFFFLADSTIPWSFKLCGLFQASCDSYLGVQYWMFGEGVSEDETLGKDMRLS